MRLNSLAALMDGKSETDMFLKNFRNQMDQQIGYIHGHCFTGAGGSLIHHLLVSEYAFGAILKIKKLRYFSKTILFPFSSHFSSKDIERKNSERIHTGNYHGTKSVLLRLDSCVRWCGSAARARFK